MIFWIVRAVRSMPPPGDTPTTFRRASLGVQGLVWHHAAVLSSSQRQASERRSEEIVRRTQHLSTVEMN
jgi:hypothetical protein